tara:strand:+ start:128 stop:589 length:462 start_codon:yes stop_codon:yes gene_type:complete
METAKDIINDSLQEMLVQAAEQPIEAVDFQTARRYLNRMMSMTPYNGLGYTQVTNPGDLMTVPDGALMGIVKNLTIYLLSTYDMPITSELMSTANEGLNEIRKLSVKIAPSSNPSALPQGSGDGLNSQPLYSNLDNEILTETGGSILLESNND